MPFEIVVPSTEPETEWVRGRPLQKVSPTRTHGMLQRRMAAALESWAELRGDVATEWRFRVAPPGEPARPLVPDIAYVAGERLRGRTGADLEVPALAPDVVVEILSPDDRRPDVDDKVATFLRAGSALAVIVDPAARTMELHDSHRCVVLTGDDTLTHAALPGFALSLRETFAAIEPWEQRVRR